MLHKVEEDVRDDTRGDAEQIIKADQRVSTLAPCEGSQGCHPYLLSEFPLDFL